MDKRRTIVWLALAAVCSIPLWMIMIGDSRSGPTDRTTVTVDDRTAVTVPSRSVAAVAIGLPEGERGDSHGTDDLGEVSLPDLPTPDQIVPRPERPVVTSTARLATQRAALGLVERSIARLERRRDDAAADDRNARIARLRVDRLRARRAELVAAIAALEAE